MIFINKDHKQIAVLLTETFITRIAMFMSVPFLMIYLSELFQFSTVQLSLIVSISPLITMLFGPIGGYLTDTIHLNKLLYTLPFIWGGIYLLFTAASSFPAFFILNGLSGICYVIHETAVKKVLSLNSNLANRKVIFNLRYACLSGGAFIGPVLQLLFGNLSFTAAYAFLGGSYIISGLCNRFFFSPKNWSESQIIQSDKGPNKERSIPELKTLLLFLCFLAGTAFSYFAYSQFQSTVSLFFTSGSLIISGKDRYSLMLSANSLLILLLQFPVLHFLKKQSALKLIAFSNFLFALSLFLVSQSSSWLFFSLMVLCYSLAEVLLGSNFDYLIDSFAKGKNKGFFFGLSEIVKVGNTLGPIAGGFLIKQFSADAFPLVFLSLSLITLTGQIFLLIYAKKEVTQ